jgi:hypothetical protein
MAEHIRVKKKSWGALTATWVPHDVRDQVVDFVRRWSEKTEISVGRFMGWLGVTASKFYDWRERYGRANEHNGWVPRDFWLEPWEKEAIIKFHLKNPLEGYRRLTFMMLDQDVVAVSPASVWRVLKQAGLLSRWKAKPSRKGHRFRTAARAAPALACRCFLYQSVGHVLLLVQRAGWMQSLSGALGSAGVDEGSRHREDSGTSQGEVSGSQAADHLRQWAAVHRARLQGVYSHLGDDACAHVAVLSAVEREDRTLAQIAQAGVHSATHPVDAGRCTPLDSELCGPLQHGATAQRDRLCDAAGQAQRTADRDPHGS